MQAKCKVLQRSLGGQRVGARDGCYSELALLDDVDPGTGLSLFEHDLLVHDLVGL